MKGIIYHKGLLIFDAIQILHYQDWCILKKTIFKLYSPFLIVEEKSSIVPTHVGVYRYN